MVTKYDFFDGECHAQKGHGDYVKDEDYEALKAERDAQQKRADALAVENAALKAGPQGFFAYSSECAYEEFDTAEKAMAWAEDEIADFRGNACDGWSDEVGSVVWGVVMQRATMVDLHDATEEDGCDPAIKQCCDYALLPAIETPATSAALAEVRALAVEDFVSKLTYELRTAGGGDGYHSEPYYECAEHIELKGGDYVEALRSGEAK